MTTLDKGLVRRDCDYCGCHDLPCLVWTMHNGSELATCGSCGGILRRALNTMVEAAADAVGLTKEQFRELGWTL